MPKTRKQKEALYNEKYSDIPRDYRERLTWMLDKYNITNNQMEEIIKRRENMQYFLSFFEYKLVLYEEPEGTPRHRYRIITPKNYPKAAIINPSYVHVYQPRAKEDHLFGQRLVENELYNLQPFIQTPFVIDIYAYFKPPSYYSKSDILMAEIGLDWNIKKPDVDNMEKKYLDMFNSTLWLDDNMCVSGKLTKFYSILPRVEIYIKYMNYAANRYQYNHIKSRVGFNNEQDFYYLNKFGNPEKG